MTDARRGFTLLEMFLALALAALLLTLVCTAIHLYLKTVDAGRMEVRQAQLARNLLQRIADDLQSAVPYTSSGASTAAAGSSSSSLSDDSDSSSGEQSDSDTAENLVDTLAPATQPGLYGTVDQLQLEVARLPRIDRLERLMASGDLPSAHHVGDVSTVAYYMHRNGPAAVMDATTPLGSSAGGLMRRALDRAVAQSAVDNGAQAQLAESDQLLAAEVAAIQFRYFDGFEWSTSWDTAERGALPVAVEVAIAMVPVDTDAAVTVVAGPSLLAGPTGQPALPGELIYRLLVHLPIGQPAPAGPTIGSTGDQSE